jgi:hypothetical protein
MQPTMNDWQRLDDLLERGLDFYGRQLVAEAIQCWREVLYLSPDHRLALEYLEAAGATGDGEPGSTSPTSERESPRTRTSPNVEGSQGASTSPRPDSNAGSSAPSIESLATLAVELIRERRLEEALTLLHTAHGEAPKDQSISRSINVVKQRLLREYRNEVGDLSHVPHLRFDDVMMESLPLSDDEREVVRLIDGILALEDIVQSAGVGALQIYRVIAQLRRRNIVSLKSSSIEPTAASEARVPRLGTTTQALPALAEPPPFRPTLVPSAIPTVPPVTGPRLVSIPAIPAPPASSADRSAHAFLKAPAPQPAPAEAPRRPTAYAAHVAEAVRAHLQGKHDRARELLILCVQECPDDPAARRNLERLKERLGFGKETR